MNQLKTMIIALLMLTSALAGCTGDYTSSEETYEDCLSYADLTGANLSLSLIHI